MLSRSQQEGAPSSAGQKRPRNTITNSNQSDSLLGGTPRLSDASTTTAAAAYSAPAPALSQQLHLGPDASSGRFWVSATGHKTASRLPRDVTTKEEPLSRTLWADDHSSRGAQASGERQKERGQGEATPAAAAGGKGPLMSGARVREQRGENDGASLELSRALQDLEVSRRKIAELQQELGATKEELVRNRAAPATGASTHRQQRQQQQEEEQGRASQGGGAQVVVGTDQGAAVDPLRPPAAKGGVEEEEEEEEEEVPSPGLSETQLKAFNTAMEGRNMFITGRAGVGKSFLVDQARLRLCSAPLKLSIEPPGSSSPCCLLHPFCWTMHGHGFEPLFLVISFLLRAVLPLFPTFSTLQTLMMTMKMMMMRIMVMKMIMVMVMMIMGTR